MASHPCSAVGRVCFSEHSNRSPQSSWLWGTCLGTWAHLKTIWWQEGWNKVTKIVWTTCCILVSCVWNQLYLKNDMEVGKSGFPKGEWRYQCHKKMERILGNMFFSYYKVTLKYLSWVLFYGISASAPLLWKCPAIAWLVRILSQLLSSCSHGGFIFILWWASIGNVLRGV